MDVAWKSNMARQGKKSRQVYIAHFIHNGNSNVFQMALGYGVSFLSN